MKWDYDVLDISDFYLEEYIYYDFNFIVMLVEDMEMYFVYNVNVYD